MRIKKILIYGSSVLTKNACNLLKNHYELVGYMPSEDPVVPGKMDLPLVTSYVEHDIKLSLQYNRRVTDIDNAYNVHTGLLPMWGGTDILYHTLKAREKGHIYQQGLTFHKMSHDYDYGPILSTMSYPVLKTDTMVDLFDKMYKAFPGFVLGSLQLLESLDEESIDSLYREPPRIFNRGKISEEDKEIYANTLRILREKYDIC